MVDGKYPRGSEWRKWDLHLHSPASVLNNQFEGSTDTEKWERYVAKLETLVDTPVIGITDYFSIRGYQRLLEYKGQGRLPKIDLILPNVELRILPVTQAEKPINLHFIFSPDVVGAVESMFFQSLDFHYNGNNYKCTRADLIRLGQAFKGSIFDEETLYHEGVNQFKITLDPLKKILDNNKDLARNCLIAVANSNQDGNSGIHGSSLVATRQEIYRFAHVIFSGNPNDVKYFLGKGVDPIDVITTNYGGLKPCVIGSDAHTLDKIGAPDLNRFTWVKADPTFQGVRQLLNEPEARVFIGQTPPSLEQQATRPTRILQEVQLRKRSDAKTDEKWFDEVRVPLNPEMIAIIGNKGSGKSALADVLGLMGNTTRYGEFSFLREERFRDKKANYAKQFEACLKWASGGSETWISLDQNPATDSVEQVKYIPQKYLELICAEIGLGKKSPFYSELEQVIFSHVPSAERLELPTLTDLLEHRGKETNESIGLLIGELWEINKSVIALEDRRAEKHQRTLNSQLEEKRRELTAHEATKPKEMQPPTASAATLEQSQKVATTLEDRRTALKSVEDKIVIAQETLVARVQDQARAEKLLAKLDNFEHYFQTFKKDILADLQTLKLPLADIASVTVTREPVNKLLGELKKARTDIENQLSASFQGSLEQQKREIVAAIVALEAKLDAPQKEYQAYLDLVKIWTARRDAIAGADSVLGSIKNLKKQLAELGCIPRELKTIDRQRARKVLEIYREKSKLRRYYQSYYGEVQKFLSGHELAQNGEFQMTFNVSIAESGFADTFLKMLNQRKTGSFSSTEDGASKLKQLLDDTNFDSALDTLRFVRKVTLMLRRYQGKDVYVPDQLRQDGSIQELYRLVFSLGYVEPRYSLQWDGKGLEQLSPGERGNLLLIFFLLVDKDDRPLIIDQPEENLDNQTIYKTLVPCIKNAKKHRQIVLVTHNPNLAVVCDAEQVIYSHIKKEQSNEVIYESGSLEDPGINQRVIDVLEGTRPAFDKRDDKYLS